MAKFHSLLDALNGGKGLSGTIGDRVYSSWNGISYSRSKPVSLKNPRTPGQLAQRAKMSAVLKFLKPLKGFIRIGFQSKAKNMSEFNYAMSFHYKNALIGDYPNFSIDFSRVCLSMGNLAQAIEPKITLHAVCEIEITWQVDPWQNNCYRDDIAMIGIYNIAKQEAVVITNGNTRESMRQLVSLPATYAGDEVACYVAFREYHGKKVSESQFLDRILTGERK